MLVTVVAALLFFHMLLKHHSIRDAKSIISFETKIYETGGISNLVSCFLHTMPHEAAIKSIEHSNEVSNFNKSDSKDEKQKEIDSSTFGFLSFE